LVSFLARTSFVRASPTKKEIVLQDVADVSGTAIKKRKNKIPHRDKILDVVICYSPLLMHQEVVLVR